MIFGASATALVFAYTRALARTWTRRRAHRVHPARPRLERHAVGARRRRRRRRGDVVPVDPIDGSARPRRRRSASSTPGPVAWVALTGASNLTGFAPDLRAAAAMAHDAGARLHVDAVARAPHLPIDVNGWGIDSLVTSPVQVVRPARRHPRARSPTSSTASSRTASARPTTTGPTGGRRARRRSRRSPASAAPPSSSPSTRGRRSWPPSRRCSSGSRTGCAPSPGVTVPRARWGRGAGADDDLQPSTAASRPTPSPRPRRAAHRGVERRQLRLRAGRRPRPPRRAAAPCGPASCATRRPTTSTRSSTRCGRSRRNRAAQPDERLEPQGRPSPRPSPRSASDASSRSRCNRSGGSCSSTPRRL